MFASFITISALLAEVYAWPPYPHPSHGPLKDPLVVSTSSGHVHGIVEQSYPDVAQFLGIPYAQPPTGTLRWEPPQSLSQPNAQVEATALPPSCMQYLTDLGNSLYVRDVLQFNLEGLNRTGSVSEDCLTLAVWAPTNATAGRRNQGVPWAGNDGKNAAGLPVLVFFYGGTYSWSGLDLTAPLTPSQAVSPRVALMCHTRFPVRNPQGRAFYETSLAYTLPPPKAQWVQRTQDHIVVSLKYVIK